MTTQSDTQEKIARALIAAGQYLHGAEWQGALARDLDMSRKRIVAVLTGKWRGDFPQGILRDVQQLVIDKQCQTGADASEVIEAFEGLIDEQQEG